MSGRAQLRVFVTGANGFIGSAIVKDLLHSGHSVLGLARSDASADAVQALGAQVCRGELSRPDGLAEAARTCDGVIHMAFIHDFIDLGAAGRTDLAAIKAMGEALAGSGRPLVVASGVAHLAPGRLGTEADAADPNSVAKHRIPSEAATLGLAARGVRACLVRLPPTVHGEGDKGFVPAIIGVARAKAVAAYIGDGANRWPAVHRLDAAQLFRLALEKGSAGARYHAIAEQGIAMREIAGVIGRRLGVPVASKAPAEAAAHFGWIGHFVGIDCPSSGASTQAQMDWHPKLPGLLEDMDGPRYFPA